MRKFSAIAADILTLIRGVSLPHIFVFLAATGIKSSELLLGLLFFGWITDFYDGSLARSANQQSWIGKHEIIFDLCFIVFASIYAFFVLPVPWWIILLLCIWIILSGLSAYGSLRHKTLSFVAGIEVPFAPSITLGMMVYGILYGSLIDKIMVCFFIAIGIVHYQIGLKAKKRAAKFLSSLPHDLRRVFKKENGS